MLYLFSSYQIPGELIEQPAVSFAHNAVKISEQDGKSNIDALSYLISHFPRAKNHPWKVQKCGLLKNTCNGVNIPPHNCGFVTLFFRPQTMLSKNKRERDRSDGYDAFVGSQSLLFFVRI